MTIPDYLLNVLYGADRLEEQTQRYRDLVNQYKDCFGASQSLRFVSVPGRTELGGNHTDHNHGKVLCAAVPIDTVAVFESRAGNRVRLKSSAFPELFEVDLSSLEPRESEKGNTNALIRGVAAGLQSKGFQAGGFDAAVHSQVGIGSGLSSSASFEVLIGGIFNALYNGSGIDPVTLAKVGQHAENVYFGKPCGLMDQLACAVGGVLSIDFKDNDDPIVEKIDADFNRMDCSLVVVHTGGSHADLTQAYASIPGEMRKVASLFGKSALRDIPEDTVRSRLDQVRREAGDRALLRTLHFFEENRRVEKMVDALKTGDFEAYLHLVAESGASSEQMLQNTVVPGGSDSEQPAALALGISSDFFRRTGHGVSRIHGGGFAGTIQAYVHRDHFREYVQLMEALFGESCVQPLGVRIQGVSIIQPD